MKPAEAQNTEPSLKVAVSELDFRLVFESATGLYLVLASDLTIAAASDAYLAATKAAREQILGKTILALPENPIPNLAASLERVLKSRTLSITSAQDPDARDRFWSCVNTPLLDGEGKVCWIIHRLEDVTESCRLKDKVRSQDKLIEELRGRLMRAEAEVFNRTQESTEAYQLLYQVNESHAALREKVEAQNQELLAFSYSVSHDLRAPLRHISGFINLLVKHCSSSLDTEAHRYLAVIADAAREMDNLIEGLLNLSLVGRAELKTTSVDLDDVARDVIEHFELFEGGRPTQWSVGELPTVQGDSTMLRVVLVNLISNALKFSGGRSERRIEIGSSPCDSGTGVTIYVRDNGVGFEMEYADKLFGVFERLHPREEFEGTGIGLATVRRIIEKHGGRTWAVGAADAGATFYCSIPLRLAESTLA